MALIDRVRGWFGRGGAVGESPGTQHPVPATALVPDTAMASVDSALQLGTVWQCVDLRARTIASLPLFTYQERGAGARDLARTARLYQLLHDSPNTRMTPFEFWRALVMNHDLRGAGYARIDRDSAGEAVALWPMPTDQTTPVVLEDGSMVYEYRVGNDVAVLAEDNVLVIKGLGNGTTGLQKLEFMRATVDEAAKSQQQASRLFGNGGKPTGVLMVDNVLKKEQREALQQRFAEMQQGNLARLYVLEANMKYQQLSIAPEDMELLASRRFGIEELCRWFDVPPVLAHHSNVTTWGTGIEQILDGWYKLSIRPQLVNVEQAVRKRVLTPGQRARYTVEFNLDALLRASLKDRIEIYAKGSQNGIYSRNECRQLENLPRSNEPMADQLTVQSNLVPLPQLGQSAARGGNANAVSQAPVSQ